MPLTSRPDSMNGTIAIRIGLSGVPGARLASEEQPPTNAATSTAVRRTETRRAIRIDHHPPNTIAGLQSQCRPAGASPRPTMGPLHPHGPQLCEEPSPSPLPEGG